MKIWLTVVLLVDSEPEALRGPGRALQLEVQVEQLELGKVCVRQTLISLRLALILQVELQVTKY